MIRIDSHTNITLFWEDIVDSEVLLVIISDGDSDLKRILRAIDLIGSGENAERYSSGRFTFSDLEITDDEASQVCHHRNTLFERNRR